MTCEVIRSVIVIKMQERLWVTSLLERRGSSETRDVRKWVQFNTEIRIMAASFSSQLQCWFRLEITWRSDRLFWRTWLSHPSPTTSAWTVTGFKYRRFDFSWDSFAPRPHFPFDSHGAWKRKWLPPPSVSQLIESWKHGSVQKKPRFRLQTTCPITTLDDSH